MKMSEIELKAFLGDNGPLIFSDSLALYMWWEKNPWTIMFENQQNITLKSFGHLITKL
jgi:hypothetical protein